MRRTLSQSSKLTRGSILVVVLVTILLASIALTVFIQKASDDLMVEIREVDARNLRGEAYSALETVLCVLAEFRSVNGGLRSPSEGWGEPLEFAGYEPEEGRKITVEFVDESGKLSLPKQTPSSLTALFESWELPKADAEKLADALLDWSVRDHVAASGYSNSYEQDEIPFGSPRRFLRSWTELSSIDLFRDAFFDESGQPNEFHRRLTETVSLFEFDKSNLNAARPGLLLALGVDEVQQARLSEYLAGGGAAAGTPTFFTSVEQASSLVGASGLLDGLGVEIRALRIVITVREGVSVFRLNVVVTPSSGGGATAVTQKAEPANRENPEASSNGSSGTGGGTSSQSRTVNSSQGSSLNYPFALLEIRENDAPPPALSPDQPQP